MCAKLEGINVQTGCISAGQASLDESIASIAMTVYSVVAFSPCKHCGLLIHSGVDR